MKKYCLALDLKDNEALIKAYEKHHREVWPEVLTSIQDSGIRNMEIYRTGNRLFMIMEADDAFSFEEKSRRDSLNEKVIEWEKLMDKYQERLPFAKPDVKWVLMNKIFEL